MLMKIIRSKLFIILIVAIISLVYGIMLVNYKIFPYSILKYVQDEFAFRYWLVRPDSNKEQIYAIDEEYKKVDVRALITINSEKDFVSKRKQLIKLIFKKDDLDYLSIPEEVVRVNDDRYSDLSSLRSIDKMTIRMDFGLESISYLFKPVKSNNRLLIYHEGHPGGIISGKNTIRVFLKKGFSVLAFTMPLQGMNNKPYVTLERFGRFKLRRHEHLKFIDSPIKPFVEPVVVALNYIFKEYNFRDISMVGISGGASTAYLVAAIDKRVQYSFPVAGGYPIFLKSNDDQCEGDFEQNWPELYKVANYLELFVLGSFGEGRKQVQIFNKYETDSCGGLKFRLYDKVVSEIIERNMKGSFKVLSDDTHKDHKISSYALKMILGELELY